MTMYPIQSISLTSTSSNGITFSNIPQSFDHLQMRYYIRSPDANAQSIGFTNIGVNGSFYNTSYSQHALGAAGNQTFNEGSANAGGLAGLYTYSSSTVTNIFAVGIADLLDYKSTNKFKTIRVIHGTDSGSTSATESYIILSSGCFRSLDPITSLSIFNINVGSGSRVDLYGIYTGAV